MTPKEKMFWVMIYSMAALMVVWVILLAAILVQLTT